MLQIVVLICIAVCYVFMCYIFCSAQCLSNDVFAILLSDTNHSLIKFPYAFSRRSSVLPVPIGREVICANLQ